MSGTINIARALWDDETFRDSEMSQREAWIWMIAEAAWKERTKRVGTKVVTLPRGSLVASSRFLAAAWMWSEPKVRRYLDMLENRRMIERVTDAGITVITIGKYDDYQLRPRDGDAEPTHIPTHHRRTTDANENTGNTFKKKKEEEPNGSLSPDGDVAEAFDAYNDAAELAGWPKASALNPRRRAALRQRLADCGGVEGWRHALAKARASPHCCGQNDRGWTASFDFLTQASSFAKLMEGNYDPRNHGNVRPIHGAMAGPSAGRGGGSGGGIAGAVLRRRLAGADGLPDDL